MGGGGWDAYEASMERAKRLKMRCPVVQKNECVVEKGWRARRGDANLKSYTAWLRARVTAPFCGGRWRLDGGVRAEAGRCARWGGGMT